MINRRSDIIDRRNNFRSPFTERRKRMLLNVFELEIHKAGFKNEQIKIMLINIRRFLNFVKDN